MRLENVWLRYHRRGPWVLRGADVAVDAGEAAVVQGRNGVGKSTLLQVAAGVLRPGRGRVVERPTRVGWVPERFPADQPFNVEHYLAAMGTMAGLTKAEARRAVDDWTERLGLTRFRQVRLPELSKGTAQKVGLAQAMLRRPGLLVLDEPWEGLDAASRELVPEVIDEVLTGGGSVLVSDHRGETVRLPGARRWVVADGVVSEETPTESQAYAVVEIAVPAARVAGTVARLRAEGHQVRAVRSEVRSGSEHPPGASDRFGIAGGVSSSGPEQPDAAEPEPIAAPVGSADPDGQVAR
ncbi:ABC transporter ATP-binding protein [Micromonospora avicenniae]|uniref:ABC-type multidrug transport system, ATPase component n=1 Tax=Micromonospora avicenniae TaxID=1198245 RepID=A0A1N6QA39_9ACTN|nr:ATP-binding cassette domain-containing protein [Micromonospora avicenniae]SIQ13296.1 ABC-type multidrug transport system, ATPase component [Micromonospora avicenniae]